MSQGRTKKKNKILPLKLVHSDKYVAAAASASTATSICTRLRRQRGKNEKTEKLYEEG